MNAPLGSADFFALEAGECLDRLETVITADDGPDASEMLRAARALRGSALMANQTPIARVAAGFEALARAVRDRGREFDAPTRELAAQTVDEARQLVRRVKEWNDGDAQRATRAATNLEALAGGALSDPRARIAGGAQGANAGVRAFVAREGALIASALDRAARSLEATPEAREPLYAVLRRMQSLRGLAELGELSPLPEVLDGIEFAVGDLTRLFAPPEGVPALLDAAAAALTRIARDVADNGVPARDPEETRRFTALLLRAFSSERDVIPIEDLLAGGPEAIQRSSAQPQFAPPGPLGAVELVSHGEHFVQLADRLQSTDGTTTRDLRLYSLLPSLRTAAVAGPDLVTPALARFSEAARDAIADGTARNHAEGFATLLRAAGETLRAVADEGLSASLAARLDEVTRGVAALAPAEERARGAETLPPVVPQPAVEPDIVDIAELAYDGEPVMEPLPRSPAPTAAVEPGPAAVPADVVPITDLQPEGRLPLERGFSRYHALVKGEAHPADGHAGAVETHGTVVDIASLIYRGRAARARAAEVGAQLTRHFEGTLALDSVEDLLQELRDLVPLAMEAAD